MSGSRERILDGITAMLEEIRKKLRLLVPHSERSEKNTV